MIQQNINLFSEKDHTFVVCAYGESEYLEECIKSLFAQEVLGTIIISTSTPNEHIKSIADKYNIELRINTQPPSISSDWNFAYKQATTKLITLTHQDDIYLPDYLSTAIEMINKAKDPIIFFSHYGIIRDGEVIYKNRRLNIRRIMSKPLKTFQKSRFIRRRLLSLANIICCPSVLYINLKGLKFTNELVFCLDWQKWEELSRVKGSFVYSDKQLVHHRHHEGAETLKTMQTGQRRKEDYIMFKKFWCTPIAKLLLRLYTQ